VPGLVAAGQVKRIAETPWLGCSDGVLPGAPPVLPDGAVAAGGELAACGGRDWLPLRTEHGADPLRELLGHGLYPGWRWWRSPPGSPRPPGRLAMAARARTSLSPTGQVRLAAPALITALSRRLISVSMRRYTVLATTVAMSSSIARLIKLVSADL